MIHLYHLDFGLTCSYFSKALRFIYHERYNQNLSYF